MPTTLDIGRKEWPDAKKVRDARKGEVIKLTPHVLKLAKGGEKTHTHCAFAMACKEQLGMPALVSTRTMLAYEEKTQTIIRFDVSTRLAEALRNYDHGHEPPLGEYSLRKPCKRLPRGSGTRHAGDPGPGKLKHQRAILAPPMRPNSIRPALNTAIVTK